MKILGHRGVILQSEAPYQNSLAAFRVALENGDGFETDACTSADGEVFLIHEAKYMGDKVEYLAPPFTFYAWEKGKIVGVRSDLE